jgi:hypothetical protein
MNFSAKEDIETPIDFVFEQITDFPAFERSALRRGAEVQRMDNLKTAGPGMKWDATFTYRGREREVKLELLSMDRPNGIVVGSRSNMMGGQLVVDLVALSRGCTRMSVDLEITPKSLSARLLIQSLKLAKSKLNERFRKRVANHAAEIEERYKWQG